MKYKVTDTIDDYNLSIYIGSGGMGDVFVATKPGQICALKICQEQEPEDIKRFGREVRLMKSVNHPRVIKLWDAQLDKSPYYFTMPYASANLEKDVQNNLLSTDEKKIEALLQVCDGISALHNNIQSIIHRDIKPSNVLRLENGYVVSDLGLGRFVNRDSKTLTNPSDHTIGTQSYMAPEILDAGDARNATEKCDIFSFGKLIYYVFTGKPPYYIDSEIIPVGIYSIIEKCTKQNPLMRYDSIEKVAEDLSNWLDLKKQPLSFKEILKNFNNNGSHKEVVDYLLTLEKDFPGLLSCLSLLKPQGFESIITKNNAYIDDLLMLITKSADDIFSNWRAYTFEWVNVLIYDMKLMIKHSKSPATKLSILEKAIEIAHKTDQYRAMRTVLDMINDLTDTQLKDMAVKLRSHKDEISQFMEINSYHAMRANVKRIIGL